MCSYIYTVGRGVSVQVERKHSINSTHLVRHVEDDRHDVLGVGGLDILAVDLLAVCVFDGWISRLVD